MSEFGCVTRFRNNTSKPSKFDHKIGLVGDLKSVFWGAGKNKQWFLGEVDFKRIKSQDLGELKSIKRFSISVYADSELQILL